jgi:hypothetical protein
MAADILNIFYCLREKLTRRINKNLMAAAFLAVVHW